MALVVWSVEVLPVHFGEELSEPALHDLLSLPLTLGEATLELAETSFELFDLATAVLLLEFEDAVEPASQVFDPFLSFLTCSRPSDLPGPLDGLLLELPLADEPIEQALIVLPDLVEIVLELDTGKIAGDPGGPGSVLAHLAGELLELPHVVLRKAFTQRPLQFIQSCGLLPQLPCLSVEGGGVRRHRRVEVLRILPEFNPHLRRHDVAKERRPEEARTICEAQAVAVEDEEGVTESHDRLYVPAERVMSRDAVRLETVRELLRRNSSIVDVHLAVDDAHGALMLRRGGSAPEHGQCRQGTEEGVAYPNACGVHDRCVLL